MHKNDLKLLNFAANIAQRSDMRTKHGCIIIDNKGNIISTAYNKTLNLSSEKLKKFDKNNKVSRHAEENALFKVDKRKLFGAKLYVVRTVSLNENENILLNSKPCEKCKNIIEKYMKKFGLKKVYYTI